VVQPNLETPDFRELRERRVDLALARVPGSFAEDDLDVEILFEDPHRVVVGARSPWARRRKITLAELANEPWIFASNQGIRELIAEAFKACGLELPQESVSSSSILLRNHLLATGRFLTVLPVSVLRYNSKLLSLKALPVDLAVKPRSVAILTLKNRTASPVVQLFVENVRAVAKTMSARSGSG
jgi:DNA-binding transcriptional LysR family regulator